MKFNKWTLGLAAVGAVSLASAARAEEAKMSQVETALSNTTISGYVSSSMNWTMSPSSGSVGSSPAGNIPLQSGKANGFNLDVVKLSIAKAQDDTEWASGYNVDLLFGPDAVGWNPSNNADKTSEFAIQQAYIVLRTPLGNGIDWKVGVFNTVVGYESMDAGSNPNYTRSWGWAVEPTEHTGVLGSYKVCDTLSLTAGVANTLAAGINTRNNYDDSGEVNNDVWRKTVMGSATFTAPESWGWAAGSAFYAGVVYGYAGGTENGTSGTFGTQGGNQINYYGGATLNSPWEKITFGAALDYVQNLGGIEQFGADSPHANVTALALYNTIKATDKLSFNSRAEYAQIEYKGYGADESAGTVSLTETVQYDLWANVVSRLEFRYDQVQDTINGTYVLPNGFAVSDRTSYGLYANLIYKF